MRVEKFGNRLAVAIPADVVVSLGLAEGDEVEITIAAAQGNEKGDAEREKRRAEAIARISKTRWELPKDWKFNREEANSRYHD